MYALCTGHQIIYTSEHFTILDSAKWAMEDPKVKRTKRAAAARCTSQEWKRRFANLRLWHPTQTKKWGGEMKVPKMNHMRICFHMRKFAVVHERPA
jgi:hypothetical protein